MSRFLFAFYLLAIPFSYGVPTSDPNVPHPPVAPTPVAPCHEQLEKEIRHNLTLVGPETAPWVLTETGKVGPVVVAVNSYVRAIDKVKKIDDELYYWDVDITYRQKWNDKRLAYDITDHPDYKFIILNTVASQNSIWKPDTFFTETIKGEFHHVTTDNSLIWLWPNGDILQSVRLQLTLRCLLTKEDATPTDNALTVEADGIVCPLSISSYRYPSDRLVYKWEEKNPIQRPAKIHIPNFTLKDITLEETEGKTSFGGWSALIAKFKFASN